MKKIVIDKTKCIGCGTCAAICPSIFNLGEDGKAAVKPGSQDQACVKEAVDSCPVGAIKIEEK